MQLTLNISTQDNATIDDFCFADNELIEKAIHALFNGDQEKQLYLFGPAGVGKSHLLQAISHLASAHELTNIYLPLKQIKEYGTDALDGISELSLICLDDIDAVAGLPQWEEALFHLYNQMRERGQYLIISSNAAPNQSAIQLPDLRSRLAWGLVFKIQELDEDNKITVLQNKARQRGISLSIQLARYLITHYARNMENLIELLDKLDKASLAQQRKLTIPFIKNILG